MELLSSQRNVMTSIPIKAMDAMIIAKSRKGLNANKHLPNALPLPKKLSHRSKPILILKMVP
jgi:hypothetical protein